MFVEKGKYSEELGRFVSRLHRSVVLTTAWIGSRCSILVLFSSPSAELDVREPVWWRAAHLRAECRADTPCQRGFSKDQIFHGPGGVHSAASGSKTAFFLISLFEN